VWSTRELPGLSAALQAVLSESAESLQASAYAFGEECRRDSGETTFLAMETDFRVRIPVSSLGNEEALGGAIRSTMDAIGRLPPDEIAGTRPGRAEFEFVADGSQSLRLTVDISTFLHEAAGLRGSALFRYFAGTP
jgi:hypothetical protein